jgi:hypothetical protein
MNNMDKLEFDLGSSNYQELSDSLEYWARQFYTGAIDEPNAMPIAYLLYNMSKEMKRVSDLDGDLSED